MGVGDSASRKNIAVFASGSGSDLQAIINACESGRLNACVCVVISNNSGSKALERARNHNIPAFHFSRNVILNQNEQANSNDSAMSETELQNKLDKAILDTILNHNTDIIFLAGYLKKLGSDILKTFENRVFNIHPSLLPKYGGKGMYGINVHTAVINNRETETGVTVHRVIEEYDKGEIIAQRKVPVLDSDTPETLAARVLEQEHLFIVEVLERIIIQ